MTIHTHPLPDETDKDWAYVNQVRRNLIRFVRARFRVSNAEEIADSAVVHVLLQAQTPGKVRDFQRVVFTHAARESRKEERRQDHLVFGEAALALADAVQADTARDAPLAAVLDHEKTEILQRMLRELTPAHRRALL